MMACFYLEKSEYEGTNGNHKDQGAKVLRIF